MEALSIFNILLMTTTVILFANLIKYRKDANMVSNVKLVLDVKAAFVYVQWK